jgi:phosphatidylserine decarboxylase
MRIHKAGYGVIGVFVAIALLLISITVYFSKSPVVTYIVVIAMGLVLLFMLRFFRYPNRTIVFNQNQIISPCDGKVVVIEDIDDHEYGLGRQRQISIFMSVWNVHINWFPVLGTVKYSQHINGRFMAAWLPKSSFENERAVTIVTNNSGQDIVIKQIAGAVARRIICYAKTGQNVSQGQQLGFIRFGSRVDIIMPPDYKTDLKIGQVVTGGKTLIASK